VARRRQVDAAHPTESAAAEHSGLDAGVQERSGSDADRREGKRG
jgi:hypothetical protein